MTALLGAGERLRLVVRRLVLLARDPAARVEHDAVDPLDVGRAAPAGHQRGRVRAAVLVRPDRRVLDRRRAVGRRAPRVVGEQRDVGGVVLVAARDLRQVAAVQDRRVPGDEVVGRDERRREAADADAARPRRRLRRVEDDLHAVPATGHAPERDLVGEALGAGEEHDVLRPAPVEPDRQHGGLAPRLPPVGARRGRGDGELGLGGPRGTEADALRTRAGRGRCEQREGAQRRDDGALT